MKRFIVREANLFEFEDVRAFYKANPDEHVMLRAEEVVKAAISEGVFFIALDTEKEDSSRIFAASAVYSVPVRDEGGKIIIPIMDLTPHRARGSVALKSPIGMGISGAPWAQSEDRTEILGLAWR